MVSLKELFFKENVGGLDLIMRALFGSLAISVLALGLAKQKKWKFILAIIGFTGIFTSVTRHCTPYVLLGINTSSHKKSKERDVLGSHGTTTEGELLQKTTL
jgi:hypothetical protein